MTAVLCVAAVVAPALAALVALAGPRAGRTGRRVAAWAGAAAAVVVLATGVTLASQVGSTTTYPADHLLRADALSAFLLVVVGAVGTLASWSGVGLIDAELAEGATTERGARQYSVLVPAFLSAMVLAVVADNLGVIWSAVEATTVATAFLVGHRRTRQSLEATWKYVVICSFGLTLAFLGVVVLSVASIHAGASPADALNLDTLARVAPRMDRDVARMGIALALLGFGTKAGLVPFHTWLADAHSQAPAPVSALMSGVLLSVAFSVLLRIRVVADAAIGPDLVRNWLVVSGLATLLVAGSLLVAQKDLKRMLAYSSLEQMGFIAVAAASGSARALTGVLLLVLAHGLAKTVLFVGAGEFHHRYHSTRIADIGGVLAATPWLGGAFAVGLLGLLGLPPFALFPAELAMARGLADAHLGAVLAVALVLMLVAFASLARHASTVLLGAPTARPGADGPPTAEPATGPAPVTATGPAPVTATATAAPPVTATARGPLAVGVVAFVTLGITAGPLPRLLAEATAVLGAR